MRGYIGRVAQYLVAPAHQVARADQHDPRVDAAVQPDAAAGSGDRRVEFGGGLMQVERRFGGAAPAILDRDGKTEDTDDAVAVDPHDFAAMARDDLRRPLAQRSDEHTSELQSLMRISYAVFCF